MSTNYPPDADASRDPHVSVSPDAGDAPTWLVYVLLSANGRRTYVGITNDLARRLQQHNGELPGGAKSTRGGRPWSVGVTYGPYTTKSEALKVELKVKKLSGKRRLSYRA